MVLFELNLRKAIASYLSGWLLLHTRFWDEAKIKYINHCKNGAKTSDELTKHKDKFEVLAKLRYCADMISNTNCSAATDLNVLNILMSLQHRAEGLSYGQNHDGKTNTSMFTTKEYRFEELQAKPIYQYLSHASNELLGLKQTQYNKIFDIPMGALADELFNRMVKLQYEYDNTVIMPVWEPYDNGKYIRNWDYRYTKNNNITNVTEALELAELYFNDWLDINLREQEMGKNLSC